MLSDEEKKAMQFFKKLKELKIVLSCSFWNNGKFEFNNTQKEQFDIILNLIEKQSKEIEELKEDSCCMTNCVRRDKEKLFLEDKIKAKIEEYDDKGMTVNLVNRSAGKTFQQAVHYEVKKVLQSLLEKE